MSYTIQPNIHCENCIKCGERPVVDQDRKGWTIMCPNANCKNAITGQFVDFEGWNRLNKKNVNLKSDPSLKQSA